MTLTFSQSPDLCASSTNFIKRCNSCIATCLTERAYFRNVAFVPADLTLLLTTSALIEKSIFLKLLLQFNHYLQSSKFLNLVPNPWGSASFGEDDRNIFPNTDIITCCHSINNPLDRIQRSRTNESGNGDGDWGI